SAEHQACLNVMPSRSLFYPKIMQGERRTSSLLECYAEPQLILSKKNGEACHCLTLQKSECG
ncbi:hypothetical protein, partial [Prevotellamassilia timonensis]|uniref:hypothetical protein n=1 Tax=Prevotellamassilia timonensis TaxID=1852370 RepID=UPI004026EAC2